MTKTKYYDLQMDDSQDNYDVEVVNANLKKIDEQMKTRENATDALQEPEFTVADKRENIASKEKMPKILGKIAKYFTDLKTVAFTGSYSDLDDKPTIDLALSSTSTNPVQNKVINEALEGKANNIIFDATNNKLSLASGETTLKEVAGIQKGYYVGGSAPENKNVLWIDALDCGIAKYYVNSSEKWRPVRARGLTSSIDLIKEGYWTDIEPGSGITYGTISAIYDINANKITVDIDKIEVASDAVTGPASLIKIKVLEYNTGHKTINAVSSKNAPTTVSMRFDYPWAYIQFGNGNGAPYGIYKGTTATSIKFEISNPSDRT